MIQTDGQVGSSAGGGGGIGGSALTIEDVARECGISVTAVSLALNWRPGKKSTISAATRERIVATAAGMGYRPSYRARALATKRSWQVAVVYSPPMGPVPSGVFQPVAEGLDRMLRDRRYHAVFIRVGDSVEEWMDVLGEGRFDGVVMLTTPPSAVRDWMVERKVPAVMVNERGDERFNQVVVDDRGGCRLLMEHLLSLGHRKISFFLGREPRSETHSSVVDRVGVYREMMAGAGLVAEEPFVGAVSEFVKRVRESGATAIVDYEHWTAIRVLQQLWREGVSVPREVSVGTFNDAYPVDAVTPSLTTVGMPAVEVAEAVVGMLLEGIEGAGGVPQRREFGMRLVVRESTGKARG